MEFPSLNEHCQHSDCNQTDFLPLVCKCGKKFCRDHFNLHSISNRCDVEPRSENSINKNHNEIYKCLFKGCNKKDLQEMLCPKCSNHYCIQHRFHPSCPEIDDETMAIKLEQFEKPRKQFQEANRGLQEKITANIRKALQSSSKVKTATKIHLMRIKQKAMAKNANLKSLQTIPLGDRLYFAVEKPKNNEPKPVKIVDDAINLVDMESIVVDPDLKDTVPLFISSKWSLGRSIDAICECCNIKNENNKSDSAKLRMFRQMDGYCICPSKMDICINELIQQQILIEGDKLIIDYVDNKVLSALDEDSQLFLC